MIRIRSERQANLVLAHVPTREAGEGGQEKLRLAQLVPEVIFGTYVRVPGVSKLWRWVERWRERVCVCLDFVYARDNIDCSAYSVFVPIRVRQTNTIQAANCSIALRS